MSDEVIDGIYSCESGSYDCDSPYYLGSEDECSEYNGRFDDPGESVSLIMHFNILTLHVHIIPLWFALPLT